MFYCSCVNTVRTANLLEPFDTQSYIMFNNLKRNRNYKGRDINYVLFCKTQEG